MKMAALQLMQQKANKDSNKSDVPSITETSDTPTETSADTNQTQTAAAEALNATEASTNSTSQSDGSTPAASQTETQKEESSSKPTVIGCLESAATQNGECKSPLEGKELEETIPGLAQAKELAETLVAEDGAGIGTSGSTPQC